jgi:hypothetical protein
MTFLGPLTVEKPYRNTYLAKLLAAMSKTKDLIQTPVPDFSFVFGDRNLPVGGAGGNGINDDTCTKSSCQLRTPPMKSDFGLE